MNRLICLLVSVFFDGRLFLFCVPQVLQKSTGAIMVLKCLYRMDPKCEADFLQEAAFMRNLCHPNVLGILGILYKDKKLHIASEFIPWGSLRSCIEAPDVILSSMEKISIAKDVSAGMVCIYQYICMY